MNYATVTVDPDGLSATVTIDPVLVAYLAADPTTPRFMHACRAMSGEPSGRRVALRMLATACGGTAGWATVLEGVMAAGGWGAFDVAVAEMPDPAVTLEAFAAAFADGGAH